MKNVLYRLFMGVTIVILALAVLTIIPWPGASTPSMLGYRSLCSASPISTFLLVVLAGGVYIWANYAFRGRKIL
jgi:hypothetical protein